MVPDLYPGIACRRLALWLRRKAGVGRDATGFEAKKDPAEARSIFR
jgi:hypothetical protein